MERQTVKIIDMKQAGLYEIGENTCYFSNERFKLNG